MKYLASILLLLFTILTACNKPADKQPDSQSGHDHGSVAILLFNGDMELFAEADQLFAGHGVDIRAHLTFLEDYTPAENGILYARIIQGNDVPDWEPLELLKPGIFTGAVIPENPGVCDFQFMYEEDELEVVFLEKSMTVYSHDDELPEVSDHGDEIIFTKEQAWKTEFGLLPLETKEFTRAIHVSGEITLSPSSVVDIISPASGKLTYSGKKLMQGGYIEKGSELFTLMSTGFSHDNILIELNTARAEYEKSRSNLERKAQLVKIEAVSKKDYEAAKSTFDQDEARFNLLQSKVSELGIVIRSPVNGYVAELLSSENSFAETGTVLMRIIKDGGLLIKANVPALHATTIKSISNANVRLPGDPTVYPLTDLGGKLESYGKVVDPQTGMIPVFFSINKPDILPGTFMEIWILTNPVADQIVIPRSSIIEEYGQYYVYVQEEGEAFEKRAIKIAETDGLNYHVLSGLEPGEVIISKGGMSVKIANAMGAPPVHSH